MSAILPPAPSARSCGRRAGERERGLAGGQAAGSPPELLNPAFPSLQRVRPGSVPRHIAGRFSGSRTFIEALEKTIPEFHESVGRHLEPYRPKPPQNKPKSKETDVDDESAGRESSEVAEAARESADEALGAALMRGSTLADS